MTIDIANIAHLLFVIQVQKASVAHPEDELIVMKVIEELNSKTEYYEEKAVSESHKTWTKSW
jgi:hypothetical protein